jgi:hypothetical protein
MNRRFIKAVALLAAPLIFALPDLAIAVETPGASFVAGLAPHQRPQGAPSIRAFAPEANWRARALTGVTAPMPPSLNFLDQQGAWYTPFNRPGMPGYYDLRQWHSTGTTAKAAR